MDFFDRITGRRHWEKSWVSSRPKVVGESGADSLSIAVDAGNGTSIMMHGDTVDYQYCEANSPDPLQRGLDGLLTTFTRVRVLSDGIFRGEALGSAVVFDTFDVAG